MLAAAFGVATLVVAYHLGKLLYGRRAGIVAMTLLAVMPYHVTVSRQVLLDAPMVFFTTAALYALVRYCSHHGARWLVVAGALMGLAILTKETAVVLFGGAYCFFVLSQTVSYARTRRSSTGCSGRNRNRIPADTTSCGRNPQRRQLPGLAAVSPRQPSHGLLPDRSADGDWPARVGTGNPRPAGRPQAAGLAGGTAAELVRGPDLVLHTDADQRLPVSAAAGAADRRVGSTRPDVCQHLIKPHSANPALAYDSAERRLSPDGADADCPGMAIGPAVYGSGIPGRHGWAARAQEAGNWIGSNLPEGSTILTVGPSMANVIAFYGHRQAYGLSVSPNPLNRNPSYTAVENADAQLRNGAIQYVVWDSFSAARSPSFSNRLLNYVTKYNGVVIHSRPSRSMTRRTKDHPAPDHRLRAATMREVLCAGCRAGLGRPPTVTAAAAPVEDISTTTPIKHVVWMMRDNHSFDNYFGTYPGADGIPSGVCQRVSLNRPSTRGCVQPFHIGDTPVEDLSQGPGVQRRQYNGGRMDGFVAAYRRLGQDGTTAMGHYDGTDLPFHWNVADEYVLFDRFFASTKVGGREPSYWVAGNAPAGQAR